MSQQIGNKSTNQKVGFSIKIEGPKVGKAKLSANDLAEIIRRTQQALKRIGQVLYGESSIGKGRKKRDIEELCEIFLVGWQPGSAIAELELAEPPAQLHLFGYIGEKSLKAFVLGMETIQSGTDIKQAIPAGFDAGVLRTCDSLGQVLEHGIDSVKFEPRNGLALPSFTFDNPLRDRVRKLLGKPVDQGQVEKVGRLEVLDGHGGLKGRLWEADGTRWVCIFKPEHLEMLPDIWMHTVKLVGQTVTEPGKENNLNVDSILLLEDEIEGTEIRTESTSFWSSRSLEKLAEQQGVSPVADLDEISALWPVDDDPDELLGHILSERSARRGITEEGRS